MADIFLSYARRDLKRVQFLIDGLSSQRWTVWWDAHITLGKSFADVIEKELSKAKCIVVVWSRNSIKSTWVKNEARFGKERQTLIPVKIDDVKLPVEFNHLQTASLKQWTGDASNVEQTSLLTALRDILKRRKPRLKFQGSKTNYGRSVFLNCPLDEPYRPLFEAVAFTVIVCGFQPRTTLEVTQAGYSRMERIFRLIASCKYGIHDISRTEVSTNRLPRFNIPLELGLFLGAQRFDPLPAKQKQTLIMDRTRFRYHRFISDLAGMDIESHEGIARNVVGIVRNWLRTHSEQLTPTGRSIWEDYTVFKKSLPKILEEVHLAPREMTYPDFIFILTRWVRERKGT